ncbi:amino acid ABC transporter permease [Azospirillum doebereinerae]|uniref:Amino acid ABC transporter permease n=1 Tax=Azospirillum doebereinerae TaxID=92933 RepID=A0A3S0XQ54_9PROT|nr:amino acid ABC transporter permease [Azospirillum doebereinerae]MCG5240422.1 amino acid ABC transporter permease [Azospirillum doebereinerae]RUQ74913.1 amino acid ABC transporter permease [Azospirillum doebereinerae]
MTDTVKHVGLPDERPPSNIVGPVAWLRNNLFNTWYNAILTVLVLLLLATAVPPFITWLFVTAHGFDATSQECRAGGGACWGFIGEKLRFILFGTFPYDEQWRPLLTIVIFIALLVGSCDRRFWKPWLGLVWAVGLTAVGILMWGGVFGLTPVENTLWGGLPLTLILSVIGLAVAFPAAILLALGRRSNMPAVKVLCVTYIELIRGVPLISLLFMASVMFPLFLPNGVSVDKLLRAQVAFIMFAAAYMAEAIRGGLQAIPKGQYEAADGLGLSYWQKMLKIILPQALAIAIPPLVNTFISFFKDTSLVIIIGLYDLLGAGKVALSDPSWRGFYRESYLFVGVIYWVFCFSMSKYSQKLERDLNRSHRR